jgi:hypothetical protein
MLFSFDAKVDVTEGEECAVPIAAAILFRPDCARIVERQDVAQAQGAVDLERSGRLDTTGTRRAIIVEEDAPAQGSVDALPVHDHSAGTGQLGWRNVDLGFRAAQPGKLIDTLIQIPQIEQFIAKPGKRAGKLAPRIAAPASGWLAHDLFKLSLDNQNFENAVSKILRRQNRARRDISIADIAIGDGPERGIDIGDRDAITFQLGN